MPIVSPPGDQRKRAVSADASRIKPVVKRVSAFRFQVAPHDGPTEIEGLIAATTLAVEQVADDKVIRGESPLQRIYAQVVRFAVVNRDGRPVEMRRCA
jgi:hypothetical protein